MASVCSVLAGLFCGHFAGMDHSDPHPGIFKVQSRAETSQDASKISHLFAVVVFIERAKHESHVYQRFVVWVIANPPVQER